MERILIVAQLVFGGRLRDAYAGVFRRKAASRTGETTGRQMLDGWSVQAVNRPALLSSAR